MAIFGLTHWLKHRITLKLLKIDRYMLWGVWQALNCLSIHATYCVIVAVLPHVLCIMCAYLWHTVIFVVKCRLQFAASMHLLFWKFLRNVWQCKSMLLRILSHHCHSMWVYCMSLHMLSHFNTWWWWWWWWLGSCLGLLYNSWNSTAHFSLTAVLNDEKKCWLL